MTAGASASPVRRPSRPIVWFVAWAGVGVGLALGISSLGLFAVPLALLAALLLILTHHGGRATWGIVVGIGLLSLFVAYAQRKGPGTVYWHTASGSGADQYLDPRPWLAAGLLLVAIGVSGFVARRRRRS